MSPHRLVRLSALALATSLACATAHAVPAGTYTGYSSEGFPVTIVVTGMGARQFVTAIDFTSVVTCQLSGSQYVWEQTVYGGVPIAADGSFSIGSSTWDNHVRMNGRISSSGQLRGLALQQDPLLTLEQPQRAESCNGGAQKLVARVGGALAAEAGAHARRASPDRATTTHLDANGRVVSRRVKDLSHPAPAALPIPAGAGAAAVVPGSYQGTNSQGHPVRFTVADDGHGGFAITGYSDSQDLLCELSGQPAYGAGYVGTPQPIAADGTFSFSSASVFSHYDVSGTVAADGSISGMSTEILPGLTYFVPQSGDRCLSTAPVSWTATLVSSSVR